MKTVKFAPGHYRVRNGSGAFGHIVHKGSKWVADIRNTETGALIRPAGIWSTRREAVDECEYLIPRNQPYV